MMLEWLWTMMQIVFGIVMTLFVVLFICGVLFVWSVLAYRPKKRNKTGYPDL